MYYSNHCLKRDTQNCQSNNISGEIKYLVDLETISSKINTNIKGLL